MSHISDKDKSKLLKEPNKLLTDFCIRIALYEMPESVLSFYSENSHLIEGDVVIVRSEKDVPIAAERRNNGNKVFFIFSDNFHASSYFSGVCKKIEFPKALIKRVNDDKDW